MSKCSHPSKYFARCLVASPLGKDKNAISRIRQDIFNVGLPICLPILLRGILLVVAEWLRGFV